MLIQIIVAAGLISTTVAIQALFTAAGMRAFKWYEENRMVVGRRHCEV
jgi:hypothetical protein